MSNGANVQNPQGGAPQQPQQPQQQPPQGATPPPSNMGGRMGLGGKAKRKARNFVLQPLLQVRVGLYAIILSILFAVALGTILYVNFASLINSIVLMTDAEDEVREIFMSYWSGTQLWVYLTFCVYLVAMVAVSVLYTHKLVGPTYAFRRHIRSLADGKFNARTYLRKGDAFAEVADELNRLSEVMEKKYGGGRS